MKIIHTILILLITLHSFSQEEATQHIVEKVPVYPGCTGSNKELATCMANKIRKHINRKFDTDLVNVLGLSSGKKRISVKFFIGKTGLIEDVKARAPHKRLVKEAIRIMKLIPPMEAAEMSGKKVRFAYSLPIIFTVVGDHNIKNTPQEEKIITYYLNQLDEAPIHPKCKKKKSFKKQQKCFSKRIVKHFRKNFNPNAVVLPNTDYNKGKKMITVDFQINTDASITNIHTYEPYIEEVTRVLMLLPRLEAGKYSGEKVNTRFSLPLTFKIK